MATITGIIAIIAFVIAFLVLIGVFKVGKKKMMAVFVVFLLIGGVSLAINQDWFKVGALSFDGTGDGAITGAKTPITQLNMKFTERYSNKYDQVSGTVEIYPAGSDPTQANVNYIASSTVSAGNVEFNTTDLIKLNTPYSIIFDGSTTYYADELSKNYVFTEENFDKETGLYLMEWPHLITKIATITDMLAETTICEYNTTYGEWDFISNCTINTDNNEAVLDVSSDSLVYDESEGDSSFYFSADFGVTGAYTALEGASLCFTPSTTAPPEGNEYSSIAVSQTSGTSLGIPSDVLSYWQNDLCVSLGATEGDREGIIEGGQSGKYKFTITVDESNLDNAGDIWYFTFDDLGGNNAKDIGLNAGATKDAITIDSQA